MSAETESRGRQGFTIPYALAAAIVTLMIAVSGYSLTLNARVTTLETVAAAPSKTDAQIAALNQKLSDFQEEYERDRVNDRVVAERERTKP